MLVAVGVYLAKVAVVTLIAAVTAVSVVAGGASQLDSVKNARDGARDLFNASRHSVNDAVVDDWNNPDGFWQRPDANERMSGRVIGRGFAGAGKLTYEAVKAGTLAATPVQTIGFELTEKAVVVQQYMEARASAGSSDVSGTAPQPGDDSTADCAFVCSADGCEMECREVTPQGETSDEEQAPAPQPDAAGGPDGTYFVRPTGEAATRVRSGELEWHPYSNYVTVDTSGASGLTVEGYVANGPDPATGSGFSTEYRITSTEIPWWDEDAGHWRMSVMVSADGSEPELCDGIITRTGSLSVTYDVGGFPTVLGASREG